MWKKIEGLSEAEAELKMFQQQEMQAVNNADRKIRVERLVNLCEEEMTAAFGKHKQLYSFAEKTTDPEALKIDLEGG